MTRRYRDLLISVIFTLFVILLDIVTSYYLGMNIIPKYFLFNISFYLIVFGISLIIPNYSIKLIVCSVLICLQGLISIINDVLVRIFGDLLSFDMLAIGTEAAKAFEFSFLNWPFMALIVAICAACIFLIYKVSKLAAFTYFTNRKRISLVSIILAICIMIEGCGIGMYIYGLSSLDYTAQEKIAGNDQYLFTNLQFKNEAYNKFGYFGFYTKSFYNFFMKGTNKQATISAAKEYFEDNAVKNTPTQYNGLLEDNNLIVIMAESLEWYAIDPYNTPTLYALAYGDETYSEYGNDSIGLTSFYGKNKTNVTENIAILGNYPTESPFSKNLNSINTSHANKNYDFSIINMLRDKYGEDFVASYTHSYTSEFYARESVIPTFGFDNATFIDDLDIEGATTKFADWAKDSDVLKANIDNIVPLDKDHFYSYFTTVTSHGSYKYNWRLDDYYEEYDNNFEEFSDWLETNTIYSVPTTSRNLEYLKYYKSAIIDLDRAVEYLLDYLEEKGLREKTTIAIFGDHNAYYHNLNLDLKGLTQEEYYNLEIYRIPCFIYDTKLASEVKADTNSCFVDTFSSSFSFVPTFLDLWGIDYKTNFYNGKSIFDPKADDEVIMFYTGGIVSKNIYSTNIVDVLYSRVDVTDEMMDDYIKKATAFIEKKKYIEMLYKFDIDTIVSVDIA